MVSQRQHIHTVLECPTQPPYALVFPCRELSDIDKDGRLSCDEYAIAMHLMAKIRGGASLPSNLPAELYPGPTKYQTVDRLASKAGKQPLERKVGIYV